MLNGSTGNGKRNIALSMRDNAAPQIFNSIFMDFGSVATMIENRTDSTGNGITLNVTERFGTPYTNYPTWTALNAAGDAPAAQAAFQAVAERHDSAVAWINLARLKLDAGDRDGARSAARRALQRAEVAEPPWRQAARDIVAATDAAR